MATTTAAGAPKIFQGITACLSWSKGLAESAKLALTKGGGVVVPLPPKVAPLFQKAAAAAATRTLPVGVTHVVCESKTLAPSEILRQLDMPGPLPDGVKVVARDWLTACLTAKKQADTAPYEIDMQAVENEAPPPPATTDSQQKKNAASDEGDDSEPRKAKRPRPTTSSLPPAPPLLQGRAPHRLTFPFIPADQEWNMYEVHNRAALAAAAAAAAGGGATASSSSSSTSSSSSLESRAGLLHLKVRLNAAASATSTTTASSPVRIAAFDLDSTLIKTQSGKSFATHPGDWQWYHPSVPTTLRTLHQQGYHIVIVSNQRGIETNKGTIQALVQRVAAVVASLAIPGLEGFFATHHNVFYKPSPGCWYLLEERAYPNTIDKSQSFYVGDAAGRHETDAGGKTPKKGGWKDFSDSDLKWAVNAGIGFKTPEELFRNWQTPLHSGTRLKQALENTPRALEGYVQPPPLPTTITEGGGGGGGGGASAAASSLPPPPLPPLPPLAKGQQEAVLLVGPMAAGKSTWTSTHYPHYTRVNQDTLGSLEKCRKVAREALGRGESIVIDATNQKAQLRKEWVNFLRGCPLPLSSLPPTSAGNSSTSEKGGIPESGEMGEEEEEVVVVEEVKKQQSLKVTCVDFLPDKDVVFHLNAFRAINPDSTDPRFVPNVVVHTYYKYKEEVDGRGEGYEEGVVHRVRSVSALPFRHQREEHLFWCWLPMKK